MKKRGRPLKIQPGIYSDLDLISDNEKILSIARDVAKVLAPPPRMSLDEWADKYRYLPKETSAEHGRWRTSRFPFLKRIMKCLSPESRAKMIVVMKGAQLGFTEILINKILYNADHYPGPTIYIQGTLEAAKDFAKEKLDPAIAQTPKVKDTLGRDKEYTYADSSLKKGFPGGWLSMGGANSSKFLRSKSARDVLVDEEDSYKLSAGDEGSPVALVAKRQVNFPLRKMCRTSSPVIKETSTIEPAFEAGSQERYYLPCPLCNPSADKDGYHFWIKWKNIKWGEECDPITGLPNDIWLECERCAGQIFEHHKTWMLSNGRWLSKKNSPNKELYEVGDVESPSFHISSLYSPSGFFSWSDAVAEWFEYRRTMDKNLHRVFVNATLGETYSLTGDGVEGMLIMSRKENYINEMTGEVVEIPQEGLCLTAGVDIQDDRIECEVVAWGMNEETWSVDYSVLWGDTNYLGDERGQDPNTGQPTVWTLLDRYLSTKFRHASGIEMPIEITFIDCKHKSENVHVFCRLREGRRIYPCYGVHGWRMGYFKRPKRRTERFNTLDFVVYPDTLKDKIYSSLLVDSPGPSYCHFPDKDIYDKRYFKGLTSESKETKMVNGQTVIRWINPSQARNEPLDCRVYASAAMMAYGINLEVRANQATPLSMPHNQGATRRPPKASWGGVEV